MSDLLILDSVYPNVVGRYQSALEAMKEFTGREMRPTDGLRSFDQQAAEFAKGRQKLSTGQWVVINSKAIVTKSLPGQSMHQFGLAIDSCFEGDDPYLKKMAPPDAEALWLEFGKCAEEQGLRWGGRFKDRDMDHVECGYGMNLAEIQTIYSQSGVLGVWQRIDKLLICGGELA